MSAPVVDGMERAARLALACVVEPGDPRIATLVATEGAVGVWDAIRHGHSTRWSELARAHDPRRVEELMRVHRMAFVVPGDPGWPERLDDLAHCEGLGGHGGAPLGLWLRGAPVSGSDPIAVVGSRACTSYGAEIAAEFGADLVDVGRPVVSGGAFGIDAAAHRGALASRRCQPGRAIAGTVAVLACGLDVGYPRAHATLFDDILAEGGSLLSEFAPGEHPTRSRFLVRNRLIAALTEATVLVEAAVRSGARNTVAWAHRLNRPVLAVPGSLHSAQSITPHRLIAAGEATLVTSTQDLVAFLAPAGDTAPHLPGLAGRT